MDAVCNLKPEAMKVADLVLDSGALRRAAFRALGSEWVPNGGLEPQPDPIKASAVLFLLGTGCGSDRDRNRPCLILNKRSRHVRQAGDLCCPGGGIHPRLDFLLSLMVRMPGGTLRRWTRRCHRPVEPATALLLAAALREGWEEMRLNPLQTDFMGPLPAERLVMFRRVIHPMVCWVRRQRRFRPNWEVERIVYLPLHRLLRGEQYARYRLRLDGSATGDDPAARRDFPCFLHHDEQGTEILWGATYRITMNFLRLLFGFTPPREESLPVIEGTLDRGYMQG